MKLQFEKRKSGRSAAEWTKICNDHFGWSCLIDGKKHYIIANNVLALDEPNTPGSHRKCMLFYHWVQAALKKDEEWKIEQWQASLIPQPKEEEDVIANVVRSTSEPSKSLCDPTDFPPPKAGNTLAEVLSPGMCVSVLKVSQHESNAKDVKTEDSLERSQKTSAKVMSSGTPSGQMEILSLPF